MTVEVRYLVADADATAEFDIEAEAVRLREAGVRFRGEVVAGPGGKQVVIEDPSGNPIELFQAAP